MPKPPPSSLAPLPSSDQILPARMLNEYVYCPRLFYYEHVEGVFVHNADTIEGAAQHKTVDTKKPGGLPKNGGGAEEDEGRAAFTSRSVSLFSNILGVSAKLDLVEGAFEDEDDGAEPANPNSPTASPRVRPVEYKKGAPLMGEDGPQIWDTDRMQLGLQILLLRENGFACDEGVIFYRETRQRVSVRMDVELEEWIRATIVAARGAAAGPIPPPLDHSAKCPRCSLVSVCLPDESRLLKEFSKDEALQIDQLLLSFDGVEEEAAPMRVERGPFVEIPEIRLPSLVPKQDVRRLVAPAPDSKSLYLNTPGLYVAKKGETLIAKQEGKAVGEYRLNDLHHLALMGPIQISTSAVQTLCELDIPITYFSMGGWFYGMTRGHGLKNVFARIEQFACAADADRRLELARLMVHGKIRNQRTLLMRNHLDPPRYALHALKSLANAALLAGREEQLLGIEGTAAHYYFESFDGMIKERREATHDGGNDVFVFDFQGRNRRPPRDPVNALLSLAYSLLVKDCTLACYAVGFDPYVGFYHKPRYGRPALALDLMEEFRPLVAESTVITLINNQMVGPNDFVRAGESVSLSAAARKVVFQAYERRLNSGVTHPVFGYKVSYRRAIELQARMLAKRLTGEIEQYVPFVTR